MSDSQAELKVVYEHFADGLRLVKKIKGAGTKPALLSLEEGQLRVEMATFAFRADATGQWPGVASLASKHMRQLADDPPEGIAAIVITVRDGEIRFARAQSDKTILTAKCEWQPHE